MLHIARMEMDGAGVDAIDILEMVVIESYLQTEKEQFLQNVSVSSGSTRQEKETKWARVDYYIHLRNLLVRESFRCKQLQHRFQASYFLPLVPPQTIYPEKARREAFAVLHRLQPEMLPSINTAIWREWSQYTDVQKLITQEPQSLFQIFLEDRYFPIIHEVYTNFKQQSEPILTLSIEIANRFEKVRQDKKNNLLARATLKDIEQAEYAMNTYYRQLYNQKTIIQQELLGPDPPPDWAITNFYICLEEYMVRRKERTTVQLSRHPESVENLMDSCAFLAAASPQKKKPKVRDSNHHSSNHQPTREKDQTLFSLGATKIYP